MEKMTKKEQQAAQKLEFQLQQEDFRKTLPTRLFFLMAEASKRHVDFNIKTKEGLKVEFLFHFQGDQVTEIIDLETSEEWELETIQSNFEQLEREAKERERKAQVRVLALEKLTEEEREVLGVRKY